MPFPQKFFTSLLCLSLGACTSVHHVPTATLDSVAKARQLPFKRPVVQVTQSRQEIREYLLERLDAEYSETELKQEEALLKRFGLIPPHYEYRNCVLAFLTQEIGGYYDPKRKQMVLPKRMENAWKHGVTFHELTHALQDQQFGLARFLARNKHNDDQTLAMQALIEGDAMLVMGELLAQMPQNVSKVQASSSPPKPGCELPAALKESFLFPYRQGLAFALQRRLRGGWTELNRHYESFPQSTEQILHPEAWGQAQNIPVLIPPSRVSKSLAWVSSNVMGEYGWQLILGKSAAKGWGGDRYWLVPSPSSELHFVGLTIWDTESDANEFHQAWTKKFKKESRAYAYADGKYVWVGLGPSLKTWRKFKTEF